jgi:hypothetical protein
LHNEDIKQGIADAEAHPEKFGGRQIKILKDRRRGALKVWIKGIAGVSQLATEFLREAFRQNKRH